MRPWKMLEFREENSLIIELIFAVILLWERV